MFTLQQIDALHSRFGRARTLFEYVRALKALGVERYDSYLIDGHSEYFGKGGEKVVSPAVHDNLPVAEVSQPDEVLKHLRLHERGETTYLEMSRGLAGSGVEKWTVETEKMTMTFCDTAGHDLLTEVIERE